MKNPKLSQILKERGIRPPSRLGSKLTTDHKLKISNSLKGITTWSKGKRLSLETKKKMSLSHQGNKHWNWGNIWKSGLLKDLRKAIRNSYKYRQLRSDVFTRDDYTCQECFLRGGKLQHHHIKPFALILEENKINSLKEAFDCEELWNINNGLTLCQECHSKTDTYKRRMSNWKKV